MGGNVGNHGEAMEWNEDREKYFLEILSERVKKDPNGSPIFKGTDWIEMDELMFLKFAMRYGPEKLKGKYHRLRSVHTKFGELISQTGVTWDSNSGQVFADMTVWNSFFLRDKVFKTFKRKGCKLYALMNVVFSNSTASGTFHNASTTGPQTSDEEHRLEEEFVAAGQHDDDDSESAWSVSKKQKSDAGSEGQPGARRVRQNSGKEKLDTLMDAWSRSMNARTEKDLAKAEKYKAPTDVTSMMTEQFLVEDCMSVLNELPSVSTNSYHNAVQRFHDLTWRKLFLCMPEDRRKTWIDSLGN